MRAGQQGISETRCHLLNGNSGNVLLSGTGSISPAGLVGPLESRLGPLPSKGNAKQWDPIFDLVVWAPLSPALSANTTVTRSLPPQPLTAPAALGERGDSAPPHAAAVGKSRMQNPPSPLGSLLKHLLLQSDSNGAFGGVVPGGWNSPPPPCPKLSHATSPPLLGKASQPFPKVCSGLNAAGPTWVNSSPLGWFWCCLRGGLSPYIAKNLMLMPSTLCPGQRALCH